MSDLLHDGKGVQPEQLTLRLLAETVEIGKRLRVGDTVRVATSTHVEQAEVDEPCLHDTIEITRVPRGIDLETPPETRVEGDTTIIPVVEEVLVVVRRLRLKEEVHVRRVRTEQRHREVVTLREQTAVITRIPAPPPNPMPSGEFR